MNISNKIDLLDLNQLKMPNLKCAELAFSVSFTLKKFKLNSWISYDLKSGK